MTAKLPFSLFLTVLLQTASFAAIPFPYALDNAKVTVPDIGDVNTKALVIGNGELQGEAYSSGNDIYIVITKNDFWDMRINTSEDAPMPVINMVTYSFPVTGETPSWGKYTYPLNTFAGKIKLAAGTAITGATLDLRRANIMITTAGADSVRVRVLSQSNVFLINTTRAVSLVGGGQTPGLGLPASTQGTSNNCTYLLQTIPGDADVAQFEMYVAFRTSGSRTIVAVSTTRDTIDPLKAATNHCNDAIAATDPGLISTHEAQWDSIWSKSGVSLGNANFQNWWYRMVYYWRCISGATTSGTANVIGLMGASPSGGNWHGAMTLDYNTQQTYGVHGIINHPECVRPLINCLARNWARAQWLAKSVIYKGEGAFFHVDMWPFEPDPATCTTKNKHQQFYTPWGGCMGIQGHLSWNIWDCYQFAPDTAYLRSTLYPQLKDLAKFYCGFLQNCQAGTGGYKRYGPSYWPEDETPPVDNNSYDIPLTNYCLKAAKQAAQTLKVDAAFVARIDSVLVMVPPLETTTDPAQANGKVIAHWKNSGLQSYDRHGSTIYAIWPTDQINLWSSQSDRDMARRTINHCNAVTTHANSVVIIPSAYARLGDTTALSNALTWLNNPNGTKPLPNGLFYWNGHGYWFAEQNSIARMISEFLVQSVCDVIIVFPCWYRNVDAKFSQLGAHGGFLVSAQKTGGTIGPVTVKSNYGKTLRFYKPSSWSHISVVNDADTITLTPNDSNFVSVHTTAGNQYYFIDYLSTTHIQPISKAASSFSIRVMGHPIVLPGEFRDRPFVIEVFNLKGRLVQRIKMNANMRSTPKSLMQIGSGIYNVKCSMKNCAVVRKIITMR